MAFNNLTQQNSSRSHKTTGKTQKRKCSIWRANSSTEEEEVQNECDSHLIGFKAFCCLLLVPPVGQDQNIVHVTESVPIRRFCYSCNKLPHRESLLRPIFHLNFPHRIKQRVWFWKTEIKILSFCTQHWEVTRTGNSKVWCETSMVQTGTARVITGLGNVSTFICLFIILVNYS